VSRKFIAAASLAFTLVASTFASGEALAADPPSPMESFKSSHTAVLDLVHKKAGNAAVEKVVDAWFDYDGMAKDAIGSEKKCEPRCDEYEALLARLIRQNYLKRINQADTGKIEFVGEDVRGKKAKVETKVTFEKDGAQQTLEIDYIVYLVDDKWVCRDVITDGVSLRRTYKYEFNKVIREGGIDELILKLENKLAEVAQAN
jgi:phospholipid transport system substrate-binding protein